MAVIFSGCGRRADQIVVASKNFTEQVILGEIIAQHLEHRLGKPVTRRFNLGGTLIAHQALVAGEIDLYPEYTGTGAAAVLKQEPRKKVVELLEQVRQEYRSKFDIEWLDPLGFNNTFAMVIRTGQAPGAGLRSLSDARRLATGWLLGAGYEFENRADGLAALNRTYGLRWNTRPKTMELGLLFRALLENQVSMIAANSTDGLLTREDFTMLEDDLGAFPSYEACILVRRVRVKSNPALLAALSELSGEFDTATIRRLNYSADVEHKSVSEIAAKFLSSNERLR
ncbi:MAG: hypothetical protein K2X35_26225 [Bryobacteraceae bacterium]|nr:hypothetical protein [Bryobacteraceae bacterium]